MNEPIEGSRLCGFPLLLLITEATPTHTAKVIVTTAIEGGITAVHATEVVVIATAHAAVTWEVIVAIESASAVKTIYVPHIFAIPFVNIVNIVANVVALYNMRKLIDVII